MSAKKKRRTGSVPKLEVTQLDANVWEIPRQGKMNVPARLFASPPLMRDLDQLVFSQLANVASLPGIVDAAYAMPDAHSGYGFPIGGIAAFSAERGGVISAGGVGFDIACGVRALLTPLTAEDIRGRQKELADTLFKAIPAGVGKGGELTLDAREMDDMLLHGARWAVANGFGEEADLERCEENGMMHGAVPDMVSDKAKSRQKNEVGTLGSGNHYLEVQEVVEIYDEEAAKVFGLAKGQAICCIHCGSRGLGHQIGEDYMQRMRAEAPRHGLDLPDPELACAPLDSKLGREYLGAMRAGINCALANRQVLTHLTRDSFAQVFGQGAAPLRMLYDVSHNTCKEERHKVGDREMTLFVHRKGATRAYGPGMPGLPQAFARTGQPVIIGGSMGTRSYILRGCAESETRAFSSANHGAGRQMSRSQAKKQFQGRDVLSSLERNGVYLRAGNFRGIAEEAPGAYKNVEEVVETAHKAGLARKVAALAPLVCVKG